jgi:hypothetical protein
MKKSVKDSPLPKRDFLGRWMYDEKRLLTLLKKMPLKRQVKILTKALNLLAEKHYSKTYSIARALDCGYDDAGYYFRSKEIRV